MKNLRLSIIAIALFVFAGAAVAGKGGPIITGYWEGTGQAMYVDGTIANIKSVIADLHQEGDFIYGVAQFEVTVGDNPEPMIQVGQMSGHISGNAITGVLGGCITTAPDCVGAGIFEGKLSGNKLRGTVVDLSDGSTSAVTLYRLSK